MLLIHPPLVKPGEVPAGIAQLAGALQAHQLPCEIVDLNIEAMYALFEAELSASDQHSSRAIKNRVRNLEQIKSTSLYEHPGRYRKTIFELNRLIELHSTSEISLSFSNYNDRELSPLKSGDLLDQAATPERNIFSTFYHIRLPQLMERRQDNHVGISLNFLSQALSCFALIGIIKQRYPEITITVGGGLMSSWKRSDSWNNQFSDLIDHCVEGCGEEFLLELLSKKKEERSPPSFRGIPKKSYLSPGFILPYSASSGCFWNKCSFCPERAEKTDFITKEPQNVFSELSSLIEEYSPALIHFLDNAIPPAVLQQMAVSSITTPWYGFARITHHLLDLRFCQALRASGCIMLKIGVESGSQQVLDDLEKGINLTTVSKVLKNLKEAGIATYVYLLFGTPAETRDEALETLLFVRQHHQKISFLNLALFNLPRNSEETKVLKISDFNEGNLSLYSDFEHPHGWNRKDVRSFLDREFKKTVEIAEILRRDPPFFTSNHAPFFSLYSSRKEK